MLGVAMEQQTAQTLPADCWIIRQNLNDQLFRLVMPIAFVITNASACWALFLLRGSARMWMVGYSRFIVGCRSRHDCLRSASERHDGPVGAKPISRRLVADSGCLVTQSLVAHFLGCGRISVFNNGRWCGTALSEVRYIRNAELR
jgi:hypothetical protein